MKHAVSIIVLGVAAVSIFGCGDGTGAAPPQSPDGLIPFVAHDAAGTPEDAAPPTTPPDAGPPLEFVIEDIGSDDGIWDLWSVLGEVYALGVKNIAQPPWTQNSVFHRAISGQWERTPIPIAGSSFWGTGPNDFYLGVSGDNGTVARSVDGGLTWAAVQASFSPGFTVWNHGLIWGTSPNDLWIGTGYVEESGALFRSTDDFSSASEVPLFGSGRVYAITGDATQVLVGTSFGLFRSTDRVTFTHVSLGDLGGSGFAARDGRIFLVNSGVVAHSDDGGQTWLAGASGPWFGNLAPLTRDEIYVGGRGGTIARSTDGGMTFALVESPTQAELLSVLVVPPNDVYFAGLHGLVVHGHR